MKGTSPGIETRAGLLSFAVQAWRVWPAGLDNEITQRNWVARGEAPEQALETDLGYIQPLARRRLGHLSRIALHVARQAAGEHDSLPLLFASRHGDLARSLGILDQLQAQELPSPAAFSLSVHNATAAVYSIARQDTAPSTALAAGDETMLWALCEAVMRLGVAERVLVVYADEPLPEEYAHFDGPPQTAHALALLLSRGNQLELTWQENRAQSVSPRPMSLELLPWLNGSGSCMQWHGTRLTVQLSRHGRPH